MQCELISIFMNKKIKKGEIYLEALLPGTSSYFCQLGTFEKDFSVSFTCHHFDRYYSNVLKLLLM